MNRQRYVSATALLTAPLSRRRAQNMAKQKAVRQGVKGTVRGYLARGNDDDDDDGSASWAELPPVSSQVNLFGS